MHEPRLRTADKIRPPYPLNQFPRETILRVAGGIVYLVHTKCSFGLEGSEWERIFAESIQAEWKPSNIGLDDIQLGNCCWGAKTVKKSQPSRATSVRLISGRNSPDFSYQISDPRSLPPEEVGRKVLDIWNHRVSSIRQRFAHARTVVLVKSDNLSECAMFEFETLRFESERYRWGWNRRRNLEGRDEEGRHRFTWQPHGSQFTVVEDVPPDRVAFRLRLPVYRSREETLAELGFDESWVEIL